VLSVSPHPSGAAFASGGSDAKVKLWDVGARACVQTVSEHTDQVGARACVQTVSEHTDQVGETFSERI
jgi:WD repeat-containing protein 61